MANPRPAPNPPAPTKREQVEELFIQHRKAVSIASKYDREHGMAEARKSEARRFLNDPNQIPVDPNDPDDANEIRDPAINAISRLIAEKIQNGSIPVGTIRATIEQAIGVNNDAAPPLGVAPGAGPLAGPMQDIFNRARNLLNYDGLLPTNSGNPLRNRGNNQRIRNLVVEATVAALNTPNSQLRQIVDTPPDSKTITALRDVEGRQTQAAPSPEFNNFAQAAGLQHPNQLNIYRRFLNSRITEAKYNLDQGYRDAGDIKALYGKDENGNPILDAKRHRVETRPLSSEIVDRATEALEFKTISDKMKSDIKFIALTEAAILHLQGFNLVPAQQRRHVMAAASALASVRNDPALPQNQTEAVERIAAAAAVENIVLMPAGVNLTPTAVVAMGRVIGEAAKAAALEADRQGIAATPANEERRKQIILSAAREAATIFRAPDVLANAEENALSPGLIIRAKNQAHQIALQTIERGPIPAAHPDNASQIVDQVIQSFGAPAQPNNPPNGIATPNQQTLDPLINAANIHFINPLQAQIEPAQNDEIENVKQQISNNLQRNNLPISEMTIIKKMAGVDRIISKDADPATILANPNAPDEKIETGVYYTEDLITGKKHTFEVDEKGDVCYYFGLFTNAAEDRDQARKMIYARLQKDIDAGQPTNTVTPKQFSSAKSTDAMMDAVLGRPNGQPMDVKLGFVSLPGQPLTALEKEYINRKSKGIFGINHSKRRAAKARLAEIRAHNARVEARLTAHQAQPAAGQAAAVAAAAQPHFNPNAVPLAFQLQQLEQRLQVQNQQQQQLFQQLTQLLQPPNAPNDAALEPVRQDVQRRIGLMQTEYQQIAQQLNIPLADANAQQHAVRLQQELNRQQHNFTINQELADIARRTRTIANDLGGVRQLNEEVKGDFENPFFNNDLRRMVPDIQVKLQTNGDRLQLIEQYLANLSAIPRVNQPPFTAQIQVQIAELRNQLAQQKTSYLEQRLRATEASLTAARELKGQIDNLLPELPPNKVAEQKNIDAIQRLVEQQSQEHNAILTQLNALQAQLQLLNPRNVLLDNRQQAARDQLTTLQGHHLQHDVVMRLALQHYGEKQTFDQTLQQMHQDVNQHADKERTYFKALVQPEKKGEKGQLIQLQSPASLLMPGTHERLLKDLKPQIQQRETAHAELVARLTELKKNMNDLKPAADQGTQDRVAGLEKTLKELDQHRIKQKEIFEKAEKEHDTVNKAKELAQQATKIAETLYAQTSEFSKLLSGMQEIKQPALPGLQSTRNFVQTGKASLEKSSEQLAELRAKVRTLYEMLVNDKVLGDPAGIPYNEFVAASRQDLEVQLAGLQLDKLEEQHKQQTEAIIELEKNWEEGAQAVIDESLRLANIAMASQFESAGELDKQLVTLQSSSPFAEEMKNATHQEILQAHKAALDIVKSQVNAHKDTLDRALQARLEEVKGQLKIVFPSAFESKRVPASAPKSSPQQLKQLEELESQLSRLREQNQRYQNALTLVENQQAAVAKAITPLQSAINIAAQIEPTEIDKIKRLDELKEPVDTSADLKIYQQALNARLAILKEANQARVHLTAQREALQEQVTMLNNALQELQKDELKPITPFLTSWQTELQKQVDHYGQQIRDIDTILQKNKDINSVEDIQTQLTTIDTLEAELSSLRTTLETQEQLQHQLHFVLQSVSDEKSSREQILQQVRKELGAEKAKLNLISKQFENVNTLLQGMKSPPPNVLLALQQQLKEQFTNLEKQHNLNERAATELEKQILAEQTAKFIEEEQKLEQSVADKTRGMAVEWSDEDEEKDVDYISRIEEHAALAIEAAANAQSNAELCIHNKEKPQAVKEYLRATRSYFRIAFDNALEARTICQEAEMYFSTREKTNENRDLLRQVRIARDKANLAEEIAKNAKEIAEIAKKWKKDDKWQSKIEELNRKNVTLNSNIKDLDLSEVVIDLPPEEKLEIIQADHPELIKATSIYAQLRDLPIPDKLAKESKLDLEDADKEVLGNYEVPLEEEPPVGVDDVLLGIEQGGQTPLAPQENVEASNSEETIFEIEVDEFPPSDDKVVEIDLDLPKSPSEPGTVITTSSEPVQKSKVSDTSVVQPERPVVTSVQPGQPSAVNVSQTGQPPVVEKKAGVPQSPSELGKQKQGTPLAPQGTEETKHTSTGLLFDPKNDDDDLFGDKLGHNGSENLQGVSKAQTKSPSKGDLFGDFRNDDPDPEWMSVVPRVSKNVEQKRSKQPQTSGSTSVLKQQLTPESAPNVQNPAPMGQGQSNSVPSNGSLASGAYRKASREALPSVNLPPNTSGTSNKQANSPILQASRDRGKKGAQDNITKEKLIITAGRTDKNPAKSPIRQHINNDDAKGLGGIIDQWTGQDPKEFAKYFNYWLEEAVNQGKWKCAESLIAKGALIKCDKISNPENQQKYKTLLKEDQLAEAEKPSSFLTRVFGLR